MYGTFKNVKRAILPVAAAAGFAVFPIAAQAHGHSRTNVRTAQEQLRNDGYYKGPVDGVDGPMTRAAIRKYQEANSLKANGRLDRDTCDKLGLRNDGEADRAETDTTTEHNATNHRRYRNSTVAGTESGSTADRTAPNSTGAMPDSATVSAAQRRLKRKGFYKGEVDGRMGPETHAALREYQKSSNLNVTGRLDERTLSGLGVSK